LSDCTTSNCPKGKYFDSGQCYDCPANTYQNNSLNTYGNNSCIQCPPDTESPIASTDIAQCLDVSCPENFYCPGGPYTVPFPCPSNSRSPQKSFKITDCIPIDGYYCV
jgi:hypothetical protein